MLAARFLPAAPSANRTRYFCQDNLVSSRLLAFASDGTYRQIDVDRTTSAETDRGTWERDAHGNWLLHPTCAGLRFRALLSGPLTIVLDRPGTLDSLPALAVALRRFLAASQDAVFAAGGVAEMRPDVLSIDPHAETFSRLELLDLGRQVDDLLWSERTNTTILSPVPAASPASPELLVRQDARFQPADLPRVRQEYRVARGQAPPFYFARVDEAAFARRAGRWQVLKFPGRVGVSPAVPGILPGTSGLAARLPAGPCQATSVP